MKKFILSILFVVAAMTGFADDYTYPYLVLVNNDGTQTSLKVEQLELTFSNGQLIATNGDGQQAFSLSQLRQMAFSETESVTDGISQVNGTLATEPIDVYTLSGIRMGTYADIEAAKTALQKGIYIVKQNTNTLKISVK